ncbi:MFS transporter [Paenibacillus yanchengensis]|uniref:MFS transporter n=1 Tax=Paenibacillus yanchengensis TaxID=2035833 RepID=A0ABW4YL25_9BACL
MVNVQQQQDNKNIDKLLRVLVFALIFSVMNGTMFNVALPMISEQFSLLPSQASWVLSGYMIVFAIGSVVYGKLADRFQMKNLITFGLYLFAFGSIVGMFAHQYWLVVAGRLLQAAGASVLPAVSMIIPVRYFPIEQRGKALGITAVGLALGAALGPIVAGLVSNFGSWRLLFLLSIISLATVPFFRKYLQQEQVTQVKFDYSGAALLAATVALLLLSITQSNLWLLVVAVLLFGLFLARIHTAQDPFIEPELFKNSKYSLGLFIAFLSTSMNFGLSFMTPQFLTSLHGLTPASIGMVMFPAAICAAFLGKKGGRLADQKGNMFLAMVATSLMFVCFALLSSALELPAYWIALFLIAGNIGVTFMQIAMSNTVSKTLLKHQVGVGMGLLSLMNFISGAIAMGTIGKLLDGQQTALQLNPIVNQSAAFIYSNIFLAMSSIIIVIIMLYRIVFRDEVVLVAKKGSATL